MSDERFRLETEEIRGLAERYGGRREPGKLGYVFSPLCWCCPHYERQELHVTEGADRSLSESWSCPKGCNPSTMLKPPCPSGLRGHAGHRGKE